MLFPDQFGLILLISGPLKSKKLGGILRKLPTFLKLLPTFLKLLPTKLKLRGV